MGYLLGSFTPHGDSKKISPIKFVQNIQDCSSNCPEQDGIQKLGVASHQNLTYPSITSM